MASLYADENFPFAVVEELRKLGHDVLTALAAVTAIAIFFVRFVYIEKMLQEHAEASSPKLPRVRQAYIVCYMLCEMVGLFGFVVYVMGGGRHRAALFILAAAALYALCYPQLSKH